MRTECWLEIPKSIDHSKDIGVDGKIILKYTLQELGRRMFIEFIWLRIGTDGGFFFLRT
jgi:hypothetical protein